NTRQIKSSPKSNPYVYICVNSGHQPSTISQKMNPIIINSQLTEKDYLSSLFYLFYRKSTAYITLGLGVIMLLSTVFSIADENEFSYSSLVIGLAMTIGIPILIYFTSKANY